MWDLPEDEYSGTWRRGWASHQPAPTFLPLLASTVPPKITAPVTARYQTPSLSFLEPCLIDPHLVPLLVPMLLGPGRRQAP